MADDDEDLIGTSHLEDSVDDMLQERLARDGVQDLGALGLEPCSFAGGQNGGCKKVVFHIVPIVS